MVAEPLRFPDRVSRRAVPAPPGPAHGSARDRAAALGLLSPHERGHLADGFRDLLPVPADVEPGLGRVLDDLAEHPGSLARAQLVYGLLLDRGTDRERARRLAIAVEYFHTASLVFDDLPAMDDAAERRGRPCPHRAHGEAAAILGALALITRAYALLWQVLGDLPSARRRAAGELVASCLGPEGVLDGQARDLRFGDARPDDPGAAVLRVAAGKTVPLVRLAVVLPAMVSGAGPGALRRLERLAEGWGLAYQVLDDFKDGLMSRAETGKSTARDAALGRPNLPAAIGPRPAIDRLARFLASAREAVAELRAAGFPTVRLLRLQGFLEDEAADVAARLPLGPVDDPE